MAQPDCVAAPCVAEHMLYHSPARKGFVSILQTSAKSGPPQSSLWLAKLPSAVAVLQGETDVYISQAEFTKPNRKLVNLWRLPLAFADIDTYKVKQLAGLRPEGLLDRLLATCNDRGIPTPSIVVFSGRGLQVKWLFTKPLGRAALPRWKAVQMELNESLKDLGADPAAIDASRVLRLEGSVNSRTGETVRVLHVCRTATMGGVLNTDGVAAYDFDIFADTLLPFTRAELAEVRKQRDAERMCREQARAAIDKAAMPATKLGGAKRRAGRRFSSSQLAWDRLEDLRKLIKMRGYEGGLPAGERNKYLFLAAVFLAQSCLVVDLMPELHELAGQFAPSWSKADIERCAVSVVSRAQAAAQGRKADFDGQKVDPRYRFSNPGLVRWLEITAEEAKELKCILTPEETLRRNKERLRDVRRARGAMERTSYRARAAARKAEARAMADAGQSRACIAEHLQVTKGAVDGYLKCDTAKSANVSMGVVEPVLLAPGPRPEAYRCPPKRTENRGGLADEPSSCPPRQKNWQHEAW